MFPILTRRLLSSNAASKEAGQKYFKLKLYRGFIGLPEKYKEWAKTLGLMRKGQINYVPVMPETMGAIIKLKELLKVDLVDSKPESTTIAYPKGYEVVGDYLALPILSRDA